MDTETDSLPPEGTVIASCMMTAVRHPDATADAETEAGHPLPGDDSSQKMLISDESVHHNASDVEEIQADGSASFVKTEKQNSEVPSLLSVEDESVDTSDNHVDCTNDSELSYRESVGEIPLNAVDQNVESCAIKKCTDLLDQNMALSIEKEAKNYSDSPNCRITNIVQELTSGDENSNLSCLTLNRSSRINDDDLPTTNNNQTNAVDHELEEELVFTALEEIVNLKELSQSVTADSSGVRLRSTSSGHSARGLSSVKSSEEHGLSQVVPSGDKNQNYARDVAASAGGQRSWRRLDCCLVSWLASAVRFCVLAFLKFLTCRCFCDLFQIMSLFTLEK